MNEILEKHLQSADKLMGTSDGLSMLKLDYSTGNYFAANTYIVALKEVAKLQRDYAALQAAAQHVEACLRKASKEPTENGWALTAPQYFTWLADELAAILQSSI